MPCGGLRHWLTFPLIKLPIIWIRVFAVPYETCESGAGQNLRGAALLLCQINSLAPFAVLGSPFPSRNRSPDDQAVEAQFNNAFAQEAKRQDGPVAYGHTPE
jgi:hypothetical protein